MHSMQVNGQRVEALKILVDKERLAAGRSVGRGHTGVVLAAAGTIEKL